VHKSVERVFENNSRVVAAEALAPALAGSCALLSFYDARTKELRVACTGDSRAVLGRRGASGRWTATALSSDQTGSAPEEAQRLKDEHPGEPHSVFRGRVLGGLEPTRAFGDASYKWSLEVTKRLRKTIFGVRSPSPYLLTPPYVTAEPVVTTTKIQPDKGDFVVMATDGLWEMLTNEEVVGLVGKWLDSETGAALLAKGAKTPSSSSSWTSWLGFGKQPVLPVELGKSEGQEGQKTPVRKLQWSYGMPEAKDDFVVEDKNVATHLIRNALGGGKDEQVCSLLTLPAPTSRLYRYVLVSLSLLIAGQTNTL
jgi:pyruvate dehydrogenase phosphatase